MKSLELSKRRYLFISRHGVTSQNVWILRRSAVRTQNYTSVRLAFNPLNVELNPICHLPALLGAHHILHVSRIRVNVGLNVLYVYFFCPEDGDINLPWTAGTYLTVDIACYSILLEFTTFSSWKTLCTIHVIYTGQVVYLGKIIGHVSRPRSSTFRC